MMIVVSGTVRSRASSRSTGILPTGQQVEEPRALAASSIESTMRASNGVPFS